MNRLKTVLLFTAFAVVGANAFAQELVSNFWMSVQLDGKHQATLGSFSGTTDVNAGVGMAGDVAYSVAPWAELGLGVQTLFGRSQTLYQGNFQFFDFFASLRLPIELGPMAFYPFVRIGYGLFTGDSAYATGYDSLTGGLFYSIGVGFRSPILFDSQMFGRKSRYFLFVEATYDSNSGSDFNSYYGLNANIVYSALSLCIGLGNKF